MTTNINTLDDYIHRSLDHVTDRFCTHPSLIHKVDPHDAAGRFLPFWGNTVVFDLDDETKHTLAALQAQLYAAAGDMLAQPLDPASFHMTLHDLENASGPMPAVHPALDAAAQKAIPAIEYWRDQPPIRMQGSWLFNMNHTSIVLGLKPATPDDALRLSTKYEVLQSAKPLDYPLCPHITLAYFKPGVYDMQAVNALRSVLQPVPIPLQLQMENLQLMNFTDMNRYFPAYMGGGSMAYQLAQYRLANGELRRAVKVTRGTAYILYVEHGLGGLNVDPVQADGTALAQDGGVIDITRETDSCWLEGADEFLGVYPSLQDAEDAGDDYLDSLRVD